jgi:UDP-2,3-diacylglucosamine pyrophosphatase LpxH
MSRVARKVYVISDLHIGGAYPVPGSGDTRGFRLNTHVPVLTSFVTRLTASAVDGVELELVINGDIVDFLAEQSPSGPMWVPFSPDPDDACKKLETIVTRDQPFFDALGKFVNKGHRLTVLLGNHDVELGLPPVQQKFVELLGLDEQADYTFIGNDQAYIVAGALIEHGNRYDGYNVVDYCGLQRLAALMSRRQEANNQYTFDAPPGSKMVAWVINPIKEQYHFIDLLMPENGAVVPLLLALEPGARDKLCKVAELGVAADYDEHTLARVPEVVAVAAVVTVPAASAAAPAAVTAAVTTSSGAPALDAVVHLSLGSRAIGYLKVLERDLSTIDARIAGKDVAVHDDIDRTLGLSALLLAHKNDDVQARLPALLEAVRALQGDKTFDRSVETGVAYLDSARALASQGKFHVVTYGHTHLAKKVALDNGAVYFNSGAWVDFMQFPPEIISGPTDVATAKLQSFVQAMATGSLTPYIQFQPTYLRFDVDDAGQLVSADLYDYSETGSL